MTPLSYRRAHRWHPFSKTPSKPLAMGQLFRCAASLACGVGLLIAFVFGCSEVRADSVVVFNEVMFHPLDSDPGSEWVELYNQMSVDVDLSGWRLSGGIDYVFPRGSVIRGGGYRVIALKPEALAASAGLTEVWGPFSGKLGNGGDTLRLRDRHDRVMDSLQYGVDGEWPLSTDGAGTSLAKKNENLSTAEADHWSASREVGGTPGAANFSSGPRFGPLGSVMKIGSPWKYDDSGTDLGIDWRAPGFSDDSWRVGPGGFALEGEGVGIPIGTRLSTLRRTYYFRSSWTLDSAPAQSSVQMRAWAEDGAVVYINGVEFARLNMPTGQVQSATAAFFRQRQPAWSSSLIIPSDRLVSGKNSIAVELHTSTNNPPTTAIKLTPGAGTSVRWDGEDGGFSTTNHPALAPLNDASSSSGTVAYASSNTNLASRIQDGSYGQQSAWSPSAKDTSPYVLLRFPQTTPVSSVAWSRDNGDASDSDCLDGECLDRALGTYTLQYTLAPNPTTVTTVSSNPTNSWVTLATIVHQGSQTNFTLALRHRYLIATTNGDPVMATGVRLRVPSDSSIDEFEVNTPAEIGLGASFGLEMGSRTALPEPLDLVFNEVASSQEAEFWLECMNRGQSPVSLAGVRIARQHGNAFASFVLSTGILPPGERIVLRRSQLGFGAVDSDRLFLYAPDQRTVLDAVSVKPEVRGRYPDGKGEWMYPSVSTPGKANQVELRHDVVINEIMYHPAPKDAQKAVQAHSVVIGLDSSWRFLDTGVDPGNAWRSPTFSDQSWAEGHAPFAYHAKNLPIPAQAVLEGGHSTYYFRTRFSVQDPSQVRQIDLRSLVDDGMVVYLNGVEVLRGNMPSGPITSGSTASLPVGDAGLSIPAAIASQALVPGENVLAVEVHSAPAVVKSSGVVLTGGGLALVEEGPLARQAPDNLARKPGVVPFALDALTGTPVRSVAGLTDGFYGNDFAWVGQTGNPAFVGLKFGESVTIGSVAFGRDNLGFWSDRTLGTYTLQFTRVDQPGVDTANTGDASNGWQTIGTIKYQQVGTGYFTTPSMRHRFTFDPVLATGLRLIVPVSGAGSGTCIDELEVNPPDASGDIVFAVEASLTTELQPPTPFTESSQQWVELLNRSSHEVDLTGWRLDGGIDFRFTNGPVIPPGGYWVIAKDAGALQQLWPEVASKISGNFAGKLSPLERFLLRDARGNPVSETRVYEKEWSDGGGSSLELKDPLADENLSEAWADSDESARGQWTEVRYRMKAGQSFGPTRWNEFRLGLLDNGVVLVDDVSVIRDPDGARLELIQNGGFETTTGPVHWRWMGTHQGAFVPDPDQPKNTVLRLSTTGRAIMNHNHVESTFLNNVPLVTGQVYKVSYRARWVAGSGQVSTRAYFSQLAQVHALPAPERGGTPGSTNSRRVANRGPALRELHHSPVVPTAGQTVRVAVSAADPDGVAGVTLFYRVNPGPSFSSIPMVSSDSVTWEGVIPTQAAGKIVQFYVSAADSAGATSMAPEQGPDSRALLQFADNQKTSLPVHELRLIMLDSDRDFLLNPTNVMSDARLGSTLIYDRQEVFYDAGARLQGTVASRIRDLDDYVSYDIGFPPDHLFRGVQNNIGIDRSGRAPTVRGQDEIYLLHMFHQAAVPIPYSDLCYFISPKLLHTGTAILQLAGYGRGFVKEQYDRVGSVFNMDLSYEPDTTVDPKNPESLKLPVPLQPHLGTDLTDLGDQEQFRSPFDIRLENRRDDYEGLMRLCRTMGAPQAQFDAQIESVANVQEILRMTALEILCGVLDTYVSSDSSLPHNLRMIAFSDGSPAEFLPWDMDFTFGAATTSSIYPYSGIHLSKFLKNPRFAHDYLYHVHDLCQVAFNAERMGPWITHYGSLVGQAFKDSYAYIAARRSYALSQLPARVPFSLSSHASSDFVVHSNQVVLAGTGWVDVKAIEVNGVSYVPSWISTTQWNLTLPLQTGVNAFRLQAVDNLGNRRMDLADAITIPYSGAGGVARITINEFMAENTGPSGFPDPSDGVFKDWIELYNAEAVEVDLGGWALSDDPQQPRKYLLPSGTRIAPNGFLLVWADGQGTSSSTGPGDLHASFKLASSGETLLLSEPSGGVVSQIAYGSQTANVSLGLWPDGNTADGYFPMTQFTPRAANRLDGAGGGFQILSIEVRANRAVISWQSEQNKTYSIEKAEDLLHPIWTAIGNPVVANGTTTSVEDATFDPQARVQYYRVRLDH